MLMMMEQQQDYCYFLVSFQVILVFFFHMCVLYNRAKLESQIQTLQQEIEKYKAKLSTAKHEGKLQSDMEKYIEMGGLASMGILAIIILYKLVTLCCSSSHKNKSVGIHKKDDDSSSSSSSGGGLPSASTGASHLHGDLACDEFEGEIASSSSSLHDNNNNHGGGGMTDTTSSSELPARHRSSQAVPTAPRPGGVVGSGKITSASKRNLTNKTVD
jgi:hypothetical protein